MGRLLELRGVFVAASMLAGAAACGPEPIELQQVPSEIQDVAAVYTTPTGTVPASAAEQVTALQQRLETIGSTHLGGLVTDALVRLRTRLEDGGVPIDPTTPRKKHRAVIVGSVTIDRICRGWDDASTTPDASNGSLELVAQVEGSMLQRIIWGTATTCKGRVDVTNDVIIHPYVDGTIAVYLEGPLPDDANDAQFIMGWNGTLGTETTDLKSGSFDFRVINQQVEVRIPVADGDIIGSAGLNEVSFRGSNGTFGCSVETGACGQR